MTPPPMARPLRPHTKSRSGCMSCKARKVKCNELRPACDSCSRRGILCEYSDPSQRPKEPRWPSKRNKPSASHSEVDPPEEGGINLLEESQQRRLLEIRLVNHFCAETARVGYVSLNDEAVSDIWTRTAPVLAIKHPFLLQIIVAIAAQHLFIIDPASQDMADVHRIYFNAAISSHRQAIQNITSENAEAIFLTSALIPVPAFALFREQVPIPYTPPMQFFHLLHGHFLVSANVLPHFSPESPVFGLHAAQPNMQIFMEDSPSVDYLQPFRGILEWRVPGEVVEKDSLIAFTSAFDYIGRVHAKIENGTCPYEIRRLLGSFPQVALDPYRQRLEKYDCRALLILAHYFSLCKAFGDVWWLHGIADREVLSIQSVLPEHWQWAMAWPLQRLAEYSAADST